MNERDREFARQAWVENDWDGHVDTQKLIRLVRADEREACAKVCENIYEGDEACGDWPSPEQCADAIRARGNT